MYFNSSKLDIVATLGYCQMMNDCLMIPRLRPFQMAHLCKCSFSKQLLLRPLTRTPETYWNLSLPHKLPPKKDPLTVTTLPMLGYLEQMVAAAITKSLTAVGNMKPKYPFMDATQSALIYVGYHLKGTTSL